MAVADLFDLSGRSIQFLHRPKGMGVVRSNLGFKQLIGERLDLGDNDDVRVFGFPPASSSPSSKAPTRASGSAPTAC